MNLCVIPARGGSKRIPRKNIKEFCGKPIIAYSIQAALESECFDKVVVSTDDREIAEVAMKYGAEIPFYRPEELANDHAGTLPVIKHAIDWYDKNANSFQYVCCLYATAPFVQSGHIKKAFERLKSEGCGYVFSVTSYDFPIQRAFKILKSGRLEMFQPENFNMRSQDLEEAFHDAGQFYWGTSHSFLNEYPVFSEHAVPFILPRYVVQDIDTEEDWELAELKYNILENRIDKAGL